MNWDVRPCSLVGVHRQEMGKSSSAACFLLISYFDLTSSLKIGLASSTETSINFYQTTRSYVPEKSTLLSYCSGNIKSNNDNEIKMIE
jgi:hypothetical protein